MVNYAQKLIAMSIMSDVTWMGTSVPPNLVQPPEHFYKILYYYRRKWREYIFFEFATLEDAHAWIKDEKMSDLQIKLEEDSAEFNPNKLLRIVKVSTEIVDNIEYKIH